MLADNENVYTVFEEGSLVKGDVPKEITKIFIDLNSGDSTALYYKQ